MAGLFFPVIASRRRGNLTVSYPPRLLRRQAPRNDEKKCHGGSLFPCHCEPKAWQSRWWGTLGDCFVAKLLAMTRGWVPRNDNGKECLLKIIRSPFYFEEGVQDDLPGKYSWILRRLVSYFHLILASLPSLSEARSFSSSCSRLVSSSNSDFGDCLPSSSP